MSETVCNLCHIEKDNLTRRGTYHFCPECSLRYDYEIASDLATDPILSPAERSHARRRKRVLGLKLAKMRKEKAA
jgi:hypothetical protein